MNWDLIFWISILVVLCLWLWIFLFKSIRQCKNTQSHDMIGWVLWVIVILLFTVIFTVTKDYLKDKLDYILTIVVVVLLWLVIIVWLILFFIWIKIVFHKIRNYFLFKELESISVAHKNWWLTNWEFEEIKGKIKNKIKM